MHLRPDQVVPADIDETPRKNELPREHAKRLATEKLRVIAAKHPDAFVLAADTVVGVGRRILPKTKTEEEARQCLALLSGRRHRVFTGVGLAIPGGTIRIRIAQTAVIIKALSATEISTYIASGEWQGKAGGYAIQGLAAAFVSSVNGSYSNVVGLPLAETVSMLAGAHYPPALTLR